MSNHQYQQFDSRCFSKLFFHCLVLDPEDHITRYGLAGIATKSGRNPHADTLIHVDTLIALKCWVLTAQITEEVKTHHDKAALQSTESKVT